MVRWTALLIPHLLLCAAAFAADPPGVWLDVPFVKQEKNGCGAASVAMVMQYWQRQQPDHLTIPTAQEVRHALVGRREGTYASETKRYFEQHGFRTFTTRSEWIDLWQHLEKGRPLIVALRSGRDAFHYVVVTGMDWQQDLVLKNDPGERKLLKQHRADFEREWAATSNWTLLALPEGGSVSH